MVIIRDTNGNPVRTSRNLRGLIAHFNRQPVDVVAIDRLADGSGKLMVLFSNRDTCETTFASYTVLAEWIRSRRNLRGCKLRDNGTDTTVAPVGLHKWRVVSTVDATYKCDVYAADVNAARRNGARRMRCTYTLVSAKLI